MTICDICGMECSKLHPKKVVDDMRVFGNKMLVIKNKVMVCEKCLKC